MGLDIVLIKRIKRIAIFLAAALVITNLGSFTSALASEVDGKKITSMGAIVIDFETGMEIYAYNADTRRGPASMTKMMTVYLVYEAIANGLIDFDTLVPISQYVYNYSRTPGETNVPLMMNIQYTVDELLDVIVVMSAGGACAALAELIAGTTRAFYRLMNAKAEEWGIDAVFYSVSGGVDYTQMTPRAMATITRNMLLDYPEVLEKTSMSTVNFRGRVIPSTNLLLGVYEGIDGFKTGTHPGTRANFSGTAKRGDIRIISVTMGSSSSGRFPDTTILLDYGFAVMEAYWQAIEARKVDPESLTVVINGDEVDFESYRVEGYSYINIRDIAYIFNGTKAQFDVGWDYEEDALILTSDMQYTAIGGEMAGRGGERRLPEPLGVTVLLDGEELELVAYDIEGENYFQISDIMTALGFLVVWKWDGSAHVISISTGDEPPPEEIEEPPPLVPVRPPLYVPPEPAEPEPGEQEPPAKEADTENTQPVPLPIVFGVFGGLCGFGAIVALIKRGRARG